MFTHAWLLWFLPLALVPILLHLLSRWRVRMVELSTVRFLVDSDPQQWRKSRWIERIILLLRILFLALVVLAISRPVATSFQGLFTGNSGRDVVLIFDTSAAMALRSGGQTSLERSKAAARTIINSLKGDDHLALIEAGQKPRLLRVGFVHERETFLGILEALETQTTGADIGGAVALACGQSARGPRVVVMLSDARQVTWASLANQPALSEVDANTSLVVLNLGATEPVVNVGVVGELPTEMNATVGLPVLLKAVITCSATSSFDVKNVKPVSRVLRVMLEDRVVEQMTVELLPGQRIERVISATPQSAGWVRGKFELSGDGFAEDDSFLFGLNIAENLNVLVVTGPASEEAAERPLLFLETALTKATGVILSGAVSVTSIAHDELTDVQLANAEVVILADAPIDPTRAVMLRRYLDNGGGLLVMPGPVMQMEVINTHLLAGPAQSGGTSLRYANATGDPNDEATFQSIGKVSVDHPILSVFADAKELGRRGGFFDGVRLYRFHPLEIGTNEPPHRTLIALTDGRPVLVETAVGRGRLMLASFAATPGWSNLPVSGNVFVPLMVRTVEHLRRASPVQITSRIEPGQRAQITISDVLPDAKAQLTDATDRQHLIELHRDDRSRTGIFEATQRKGFYSFTISPGQGQTIKPITQGFAVNLDGRQSNVSAMSETQMRKLFGSRDVTFLQGSADDPQLARELMRKSELWRTLIWLLLAIIGFEFMLSTRSNVKSEKAFKR